jgi:hypothetical protein
MLKCDEHGLLLCSVKVVGYANYGMKVFGCVGLWSNLEQNLLSSIYCITWYQIWLCCPLATIVVN